MSEQQQIVEEVFCPLCKSGDYLSVQATSWFKVLDNGVEQEGDVEWLSDAPCKCRCGWSGIVYQVYPRNLAAEEDFKEQVNRITSSHLGFEAFGNAPPHGILQHLHRALVKKQKPMTFVKFYFAEELEARRMDKNL